MNTMKGRTILHKPSGVDYLVTSETDNYIGMKIKVDDDFTVGIEQTIEKELLDGEEYELVAIK